MKLWSRFAAVSLGVVCSGFVVLVASDASAICQKSGDPSARILSPANGQTVAGVVEIRYEGSLPGAVVGTSATDRCAPLSLEYATLQIDGNVVARAPSGRFAWDTRQVANGPHSVLFQVRDNYGGNRTSLVNVQVRNASPQVLGFDDSTGRFYFGLMQGQTISRFDQFPNAFSGTNVDYSVADFNGDRTSDFCGRDRRTGEIWIFFSTGKRVSGTRRVPGAVIGTNVDVMAADFNGDGRADLLGRDRLTGTLTVYFMDGGQITSSAAIPGARIGANVELFAGDMNGDGFGDLVGRDGATGEMYVYYLRGNALAGGGRVPGARIGSNVDLSVGDYDGNGRGDLLGRDRLTGQLYLFYSDGFNFSAGSPIPGARVGNNMRLFSGAFAP